MDAREDRIAPMLLRWYDEHARDLPWRSPPGSPPPDPYRVWLSEVMLQQTTVAAVKPYFAKFTSRWPNVDVLADAPEDEVMAAWAGLGYYSRARNLMKAAQILADMGGFPETEAELRRLPGVGGYTAAAIAAIAFDRRAVVVDANVERVVARLFAIGATLPKARKAIREAADRITPRNRAGDFAQAMMDLGSAVCTPHDPECRVCPLRSECAATVSGEPERYPLKPPKRRKPEIRGTAFWIERDAQVWLVTRPAGTMLAGMKALPDDGWTAREHGSGDAPFAGDWVDAGAVRHGFTHANLTLTVRRCSSPPSLGEGMWWPVARLEEAGLPTLFKKAARLALAAEEPPKLVH